MNPARFPAIPEDTASAARAIFGKSNLYLCIGDHATSQISDLVYQDQPKSFQVQERMILILSLVTIFQFIETLPDHKAADATRERIDWKYALHLPLSYSGLEARLLREFRRWLLADRSARESFQRLLDCLPEVLSHTNIKHPNWEANQVLSAVCLVSRLASVWEAMSQALEALATRQPEWLRSISLPHWYLRYTSQKLSLYELSDKEKRKKLARSIGVDGFYLLQEISSSNNSALVDLPQVRSLKHIWQENYLQSDGEVIWKDEICAG